MSALELIVVLAVLAFLAAMIVPAMRPRVIVADAAGLTSTLRSLRHGIQTYREHTGFYPSSVFQLVSIPGQQNAPLTNSCGTLLASTALGPAWRGPYIAQQVGVGGIQTGAMAVSEAFTQAVGAGDLGTLRINVLGVPQSVAERVDAAFDGGTFSPTSGAITWADTGAVPGVLVYRIPVSGC